MKARCGIILACVLVLGWQVASGQVTTGTPWLGSFDGGPDVINLGNLNVSWTFPMINKPGRGIPFVLAPTLDSSIWYPVTSGSTTSWPPLTSWGWIGLPGGYAGKVTNTTTTLGPFICGQPVNGNSYYYSFYEQLLQNWAFVDARNTPHPFSGLQTTYVYTGGNGCQSAPPPNSQPTDASASDGSGYRITAYYSGYYSVSRADGVALNLAASGNTKQEDVNGNYISCSNSSCTDTLGINAMTVAGSSTAPPMTISVPGVSQSYIVNYTTRTVQTKFLCPSIQDYGPTSVPLISSIVFPDGTQYSFDYEKTQS